MLSGLPVVAQHVKPLCTTPASLMGVLLVLVPATLPLIWLPANVPWKAVDNISSIWVSATHIRHGGGVLGSWLSLAQPCLVAMESEPVAQRHLRVHPSSFYMNK